MKCLLCKQALSYRFTIRDIVWPTPIRLPVVCHQCWVQFKQITGPVCAGCGRPQKDSRLCKECQDWQTQYGWTLKHRALFNYNAAMRDFMHQYKFNGDYQLRRVFQPEMTAAVQQAGGDMVVPIPVSPTTLKTRGFNQVLGLLVSKQLCCCLQTRHDHKKAQSQKSRQERLATKQPFCLVNSFSLAGQRILLVDDVYTTGRTLYHAAELLYGAGAQKVISISLAR